MATKASNGDRIDSLEFRTRRAVDILTDWTRATRDEVSVLAHFVVIALLADRLEEKRRRLAELEAMPWWRRWFVGR